MKMNVTRPVCFCCKKVTGLLHIEERDGTGLWRICQIALFDRRLVEVGLYYA